MEHPIYRVTGLKRRGPFVLEVAFDDGTSQLIDFRPVLRGEIYGPLSDPRLFEQVRIDKEAHTLVWPNGADFDPTMLHDWADRGPDLHALVANWAAEPVR